LRSLCGNGQRYAALFSPLRRVARAIRKLEALRQQARSLRGDFVRSPSQWGRDLGSEKA